MSNVKATSFKFDEKTTELLDKLKAQSHASSRTEVLRKAIYLLNEVAEAQERDEEVIIRNKDRDSGQPEKKIVMY